MSPRHDGRSKEGRGFVGYGDGGVRRCTANTQSTHIVSNTWVISARITAKRGRHWHGQSDKTVREGSAMWQMALGGLSTVSQWTSGLGFACLVVQRLSAVLSPRCACEDLTESFWTRHLPRRRVDASGVGQAGQVSDLFFCLV